MDTKLTETQRRELRHMLRYPGSRSIRFQTGESLRKRGLATRYTVHAIAAFYADRDGVAEQYDHSASGKRVTWHEWEATPAGRAALADRTDTTGGE